LKTTLHYLLQRPIPALRLELYHMYINPIFPDKSLRTALFCYHAAGKNNDFIHPGNSTHTVGNDYLPLAVFA